MAHVANRLLAKLPPAQRKRLLAKCELEKLHIGDVLCEAGRPLTHVYFPTEGLISITSPIDGRADLEVALVGDEGMVGASLALVASDSTLQGVVQSGGWAWRLSAASFRKELQRSAALSALVNGYLATLIVQLARGSGCARFHVIQSRLARWLLMAADRIHADEFTVTQESIARILGVRRVGITSAAGALRQLQLIGYHRGHVTILDRLGLEAMACACYRAGVR